MLNVFSLSNGRLFQEEIESLEELARFRPIWVDLEEPTLEEKRWVKQYYGLSIPEDAIDDDIEESARFYEEDNGELHIRSDFLLIDTDDEARQVRVAFILNSANDQLRSHGVLFSIHDETVPAFRLLRMRARRMPGLLGDAKDVLLALLMNVVDNPVHALMNANYIGILAWAVGFGMAMRHASAGTRTVMHDLSAGITVIIQVVIRFAPLGIFGLVASTFAEAGAQALWGYAHLLAVLLGCMVFVALVVNPLIVFLALRINPYPLVFTCLRESGVTAFFTRSSAANIPINLALAKRLNLNEDTYSIAIPLGATINMAGAAITISVLSLAAVHTLGIAVEVPTALLLCVVAAVCACGASGVAGGSLLLIPLACSLFGISNDVAMQVVAIGFIIGILQDSAETALNSSTDVLFTAVACRWAEPQPPSAR